MHDTDTYGNTRTLFSLKQPHRALRVLRAQPGAR